MIRRTWTYVTPSACVYVAITVVAGFYGGGSICGRSCLDGNEGREQDESCGESHFDGGCLGLTLMR